MATAQVGSDNAKEWFARQFCLPNFVRIENRGGSQTSDPRTISL